MAVISSLQAGLKVNSTGNTLNTGEIQFGDTNGFFPMYAGATGVTGTGQLLTGGVYLTLNPAAGPSGAVQTLIKGEAATLSIEYNSNNQCRFDLTPLGSVTISSPWVSVGVEHSVGVSYDTTSGFTTLSVDGTSQTTIASYTTTGTTDFLSPGQVIGTNSGLRSTTPTYNGYIDQVATFNTAPSVALLNQMTSDPAGTNSALNSHLETQANTFATVVTGASGFGNTAGGAPVGTIQLTPVKAVGIQVGDIITDATTSAAIPTSSTYVTKIDSTGLVTLNNAITAASWSASDNLVFSHPQTKSVTLGAALTANSSTITPPNPTGIQAGDFVSGFDVPANDTVSSISVAGQITLSVPLGSNVTTATNEALLFTHPSATANVNATVSVASATAVQTLVTVQGIQVGDVALGVVDANSNPVPNDHVVGIDQASGNVTLASPVNTTVGQNITFVHSTMATGTSSGNAAVATTIVLNAPPVGTIVPGDIITDNTTPGTLVNETVLAFNSNTRTITLSAPAALAGAAGDALTFTHATSTNTTGTLTAGSSVVTLNSGVGVQAGDILVDLTNSSNDFNTATVAPNKTTGVTVTGVNGNLVTLSATLPNAFTGDSLSFIHQPAASGSPANSIVPPATTGTTNTVAGYQLASSANTLLYLNNTNGILEGDFVTGPNIPAGDTVATGGVTSTGVTLKTGTTLPVPAGSSFIFTHPTNPNVQVITIASTATGSSASYKVGDTITVTASSTANTTTSATYTIASSDIGSTVTATNTNIAKSFVNANPVLGAYTLLSGPASGQIELVPNTGTAQVLPLATVTSTDSAGINENIIANFYNFANTKSASPTTTGAAGGGVTAATFDSSGLTATSVATASYATTAATSATPQTHGPIYAELSNLNGTTATYNLFVDGSSVTSGVLNSVGLTINVPAAQGTIGNITPSSAGTITQVNNTGTGSVSYQWASNTGVTNFTQPIGQLTVNLTSNAVNTINATVTNMSVNSVNYKDPVQNVPMLENSLLNSQVYTVTGHFYDQFNPNGAYGLSNSGTPWGQYTSQVALSNNDFSYTVAGTAASDLKLNVEQANLSPVTQAAPNANIALDLVATSMPAAWTSAKAMPFTVTIDVPSNATGVTFNPGTGVTLTSSTSTVGHTLTLTGTYSAPSGKGAVGTSTPTLGVLSATLTNEFNNGGQFSMDTVSINGNAAVGQSLYFGMGEANSAGAYSISNLPAGKLAITPFNNVSQVNPSTITVTDVLAVMSIAAGKGVPGGLGQSVGATANLLPSDFVAADYNQDGQVTAADALSMLNYIVSVNKSNTPGFTYLSATGNALMNTAESTTAVVTPAITPVATNLSSSNAVLVTGDSSKVVDIIGVLPGNVVNY